MNGFVSKAQFIRYPGAKVLNEDVGVLGQLLGDLPALLLFQVKGDGLLAAVPDHKSRQITERVTARPLYFDHLCPLLGQQPQGDFFGNQIFLGLCPVPLDAYNLEAAHPC